MNKILKTLFLIITFGIGLLILCIFSLGDDLLHVYYLDVGQGDGILIRTPANEYIVIDGGPNDAILTEISRIMPFYERTIDVMILTHPHADHIDGLIEILERYKVNSVVITGVLYDYAGYERFYELLINRSVPVYYVNGEVDFKLGNIIFDMLYPLESLQGTRLENVNNSSITFRLIYGDSAFYFSGDLEVEGEEKLVERNLDLSANVFKSGHHGSRTSNSTGILHKIDAEIAVISCGVDNPFKHPHAETIAKFNDSNMGVLRTDLDGTIEIVSDGDEIMSILQSS